MNFIFPYIGNFIIPTDELIFFRGVGQPPTRCKSGKAFLGHIHGIPWYLRLISHSYGPGQAEGSPAKSAKPAASKSAKPAASKSAKPAALFLRGETGSLNPEAGSVPGQQAWKAKKWWFLTEKKGDDVPVFICFYHFGPSSVEGKKNIKTCADTNPLGGHWSWSCHVMPYSWP